MDDKALISNLLVQGSDRVQLVVFKEARAEIWKIFRLVYLDNKPMPYAVCVKCLKPVAYCKKTTGSLHKVSSRKILKKNKIPIKIKRIKIVSFCSLTFKISIHVRIRSLNSGVKV